MSVILFLILFSVGFCFAQDGTAQARGDIKTLEERVEIRTNKMVGELALTQEQAAKLKEILHKQAEKMNTVREKQAAENKKFREEATTIATETEKEYQAILTPEQFEKYKQNKAQKIEGKRYGSKGGRKPGKRL